MPHWIDVDDGLPIVNRIVFVFAKSKISDGYYITTTHLTNEGTWAEPFEDFFDEYVITHWVNIFSTPNAKEYL